MCHERKSHGADVRNYVKPEEKTGLKEITKSEVLQHAFKYNRILDFKRKFIQLIPLQSVNQSILNDPDIYKLLIFTDSTTLIGGRWELSYSIFTV